MNMSLRDRWDGGGAALGAWLSLPASAGAELIGGLGFDYVCVDLQHGVIDYAQAVPVIQAIVLGGSLPIARVPWNEPGIIAKVLDAGARAVIVPYVESVDQAAAAVAACRYPPEGSRSYGPTLASLRRTDSTATANADVAVVVMIETVAGVEALDSIVEVPGLDAVYVGPADLSLSLGLPAGNHDDHPGFAAALDHIVTTCVAHGVVPGIHASAALAPRRLAQGFRMVTVSSDMSALRTTMAADLEASRRPSSSGGSVSDLPMTGY